MKKEVKKKSLTRKQTGKVFQGGTMGRCLFDRSRMKNVKRGGPGRNDHVSEETEGRGVAALIKESANVNRGSRYKKQRDQIGRRCHEERLSRRPGGAAGVRKGVSRRGKNNSSEVGERGTEGKEQGFERFRENTLSLKTRSNADKRRGRQKPRFVVYSVRGLIIPASQ